MTDRDGGPRVVHALERRLWRCESRRHRVVHANTKFNGEFFGAKKEVLPPDIVMRHTYKSASATPLLNTVAKVAGK